MDGIWISKGVGRVEFVKEEGGILSGKIKFVFCRMGYGVYRFGGNFFGFDFFLTGKE